MIETFDLLDPSDLDDIKNYLKKGIRKEEIVVYKSLNEKLYVNYASKQEAKKDGIIGLISFQIMSQTIKNVEAKKINKKEALRLIENNFENLKKKKEYENQHYR